ncbi:MAG: hypothetical protein R3195_12965 [Gemmatimonadota bacterium]|nr:hypothetical protein [Gemmatimonadota bacterium]
MSGTRRRTRAGSALPTLLATLVLSALTGATRPSDLAGIQDPVSPHGALPERLDCLACHTGSAWTPARDELDFDHDRETAFELRWAHARASCGTCHLSLRFDEPGAECATCHVDIHRGSLGSDCASCHDTERFVYPRSPFQHALTAFPLTGAHLQQSCESCHVDDRGGLYSGADTECVSCHRSDYETNGLVDHVDAGFSTDCLECHTTDAWLIVPAFDHLQLSGFPLLEAHGLIACEACHIRATGQTKFSPTTEGDCYTCHRVDYERHHPAADVSTECLMCHTRSDWAPLDPAGRAR